MRKQVFAVKLLKNVDGRCLRTKGGKNIVDFREKLVEWRKLKNRQYKLLLLILGDHVKDYETG
jgi:hypothetical protein